MGNDNAKATRRSLREDIKSPFVFEFLGLDNPPIGILMCTEVGAETAEYATAGLDQQLFISKYELQLPSPEKITDFLRQEVRNLTDKKWTKRN